MKSVLLVVLSFLITMSNPVLPAKGQIDTDVDIISNATMKDVLREHIKLR